MPTERQLDIILESELEFKPHDMTDNERLYYNGMEALQTALNDVDAILLNRAKELGLTKLPEGRSDLLNLLLNPASPSPVEVVIATLEYYRGIIAGYADRAENDFERSVRQQQAGDLYVAVETLGKYKTVIEEMGPPPASSGEEATIADYKEVLADHQASVREIDFILHGKDAAKQASLIDLIGPIKRLVAASSGETMRLEKASKLKECIIKHLLQNPQNADKPYLVSGNKKYTQREIAHEIYIESEMGIETITKVLMLALDLTARGKSPTVAASPSDTREEAIKELVEFARDLSVNYDCDSDAHKYNTQCRKCEGKRLHNLYTQSLNK